MSTIFASIPYLGLSSQVSSDNTFNTELSDRLEGDIDNNLMLNYDDLKIAKKYLLNQMNLDLDTAKTVDLNNDGTINAFDIAILKQTLLNKTIKDYGTPPNTSATLYVDFTNGFSSNFQTANGWTNGGFFDCIWRDSNVQIEDENLTLTIDTDSSSQYKYSGGEYRSINRYSYGKYEVSMMPIKNDGVVSSFFTYEDPAGGGPSDEIDIEFLGKDTTKVQFNYFLNGSGNHEHMHDLGFDATEGFHTYGFDWQKDSITWYVDGVPVYTATENIPTEPSKIMMNVWPGIYVDGWLNPYDGTTPLTARYQWITYTAAD